MEHPSTWKSKLQIEIDFLTIEVEHAAFPSDSREVMQIIEILRETSLVMDMPECSKYMKCPFFEDNNESLELAKTTKIRHRTNHISIKHQHFRNFVEKDFASQKPIGISNQEVNFLPNIWLNHSLDIFNSKS